jgi:hypothetical protein
LDSGSAALKLELLFFQFLITKTSVAANESTRDKGVRMPMALMVLMVLMALLGSGPPVPAMPPFYRVLGLVGRQQDAGLGGGRSIARDCSRYTLSLNKSPNEAYLTFREKELHFAHQIDKRLKPACKQWFQHVLCAMFLLGSVSAIAFTQTWPPFGYSPGVIFEPNRVSSFFSTKQAACQGLSF